MKILITIFEHETKTFNFLKANYKRYKLYMFWTNIFREKEISDQTKGTSLLIAGFIESLIRNK